MKNVQRTHIKIIKMYDTAGLFTLMTIVILIFFKTQSQKKSATSTLRGNRTAATAATADFFL